MTTHASTAPAALDALLAMFTAAAADNTSPLYEVDVREGPVGDDAGQELIVLGNISWDEDDWHDLGARHREETYTLDVYINSLISGAAAKDVRDRTFAMSGAVEALLVADPKISNTVNYVDVRLHAAHPHITDSGRVFQVDLQLRFHARI